MGVALRSSWANKLSFLIPANDKNPAPPLLLFEKAQGLLSFDFLRPKDLQKIANPRALSMG
jgi:hypothetical protein